MGLWGTFERALIWNGTREAFYEARRARRQRPAPSPRGPTPRSHPANDEVLVNYECQRGHAFVLPFHDRIPSERELAAARCPDCGSYGHWLSLDYHKENDGQPARY